MNNQHLKQTLVSLLQILLTPYILEQSVEQRVRVIIDELKKLDRTYFGKDRVKQMKSKLD